MITNNKKEENLIEKKNKIQNSSTNLKKQEQISLFDSSSKKSIAQSKIKKFSPYPSGGTSEDAAYADFVEANLSLHKGKSRRPKRIKVGDICELKISAVGPNNIGIDEFTFPYPVFISNASNFYGGKIKAKMLKIVISNSGVSNSFQKTVKEEHLQKGQKLKSYAVAKYIEEVKESKKVISGDFITEKNLFENLPVKPGDILTVSIQKKGSLGLVELKNNFRLIVPLSLPLVSYENIKVKVTRLKKEYGFATLFIDDSIKQNLLLPTPKMNVGTKFTTTLPLNAKIFGHLPKYLLFKTSLTQKGSTLPSLPLFGENILLFVKLEKGIALGDKVRIKIKSICSMISSKFESLNQSSDPLVALRVNPSKAQNFIAIGKILQLPSTQLPNRKVSISSPLFSPPLRDEATSSAFALQVAGQKGLTEAKASTFLSKNEKTLLVMKSIREMVNHGMHFGEKASKCHARMKNFIWLKTNKKKVLSKPPSGARTKKAPLDWQPYPSLGVTSSPLVLTTEGQGLKAPQKLPVSLEEANSSSRKLKGEKTMIPNPKEARSAASSKTNIFITPELSFSPFLFSFQNFEESGGYADKNKTSSSIKILKRPLIKKGRHIINLLKTRRCLNKALKKLSKYALKGRTFLFIGTKKSASALVARASFFTKNSFYVNTRWLGGMLTNWKTICKSISKIRPILKEKQKVIREILEKRQIIKSRLIKKALLLRKKSKLILIKGRFLVETLKKMNEQSSINTTVDSVWSYLSKMNGLNGNYSPPTISAGIVQTSPVKQLPNLGEQNKKNYTVLRSEFLSRGKFLLEKRRQLLQKRREFILQSFLFRERGLQIFLKQKALLNQLAIYSKKLGEYKYLLILTSEIGNLGISVLNKESSYYPESQEPKTFQNSNLVSVSYNKLKELSLGTLSSSMESWIIPNPPKEILNKMILTMKNQSTFEHELSSDITTISSNAQSIKAENSIIVCSTLLSKFARFSSYLQFIMKNLMNHIQILETESQSCSVELNQIQSTLKMYIAFKNKYVLELEQFKTKLMNERSTIRIIKRQLKALDAQKKLIKFLPRLRFLPTPQNKISEVVQVLLSKIVDPKFKYPIENIYDQKLNNTSKKLAAARKKKWQRLEKYFGGIANMTKLTKSQISKNIAIIIGQNEEMNAVRECQKLAIKMFTIVDTNCNPILSDHIIPANDDSRSSIKYILTQFITRIRLAQKIRSRLQKLNLTFDTQKKIIS